MKPGVRVVGVLGVAGVLAACGASPTPPPPPASPKPVAAAPAQPVVPKPATPVAAAPAKPGQAPGSVTQQTAAAAKAAAQALAAPDVHYKVKGRRDPFENLETLVKEREATSAASAVTSAKLTGIVRGQTTLALVETTQGMGYVLKTGDMLGEGRLIEIGADQVVFSVPPKPGATTNRVVLKIARE